MAGKKLWVGIDVGKQFHYACAVDADGKTVFSRKIKNRQVAIEELITRAQKDPAAAEILAGAGTILGQAIGNLVNVFNPQKIILGGEGVRMGSLFFDPLRRAVERRVVPALYADLTIQLESWGNDAWARGAASLVLRNLFESPIYQSPVETA